MNTDANTNGVFARHPAHEQAATLVRAGFSVVPIRPDGSKAPALSEWGPYQQTLPLADEIDAWFESGRNGIAVIGGAVSGNLAVLDIEFSDFFSSFCELVDSEKAGLIESLPHVKTPGRCETGGHHLYFRTSEALANTKLARLTPEEAERRTADKKKNTAIEIKGEGGYVLAPGCPAACHPTRRTYEHIGGPFIEETPVLTDAEVELLLNAAKSLNQWQEKEETATPTDKKQDADGELRPGDDFERRATWEGIFKPHGWNAVRQRRDGAVMWRRPGKTESWSATTGACKSKDGIDLFYVFSTNAEPFKAETAYGKFRAYAILNHGGDLHAAASALYHQGYGTRLGGSKSPTGSAAEDDEPWEPIHEFCEFPVRPFPFVALPAWLRDYVQAECTATQTPVDLAAQLTLTCIGASLAKKFRVLARPGWSEPTNLFSVTVLPPGNRKSAVFADVMEPLRDYERAELKRMTPVIAEAQSRRRTLEGRLKAAEGRAAKAKDSDGRLEAEAEAKRLACELADFQVPASPRVFADDITAEMTARLLMEQGGRLLIASPEGTVFEIIQGRYSETPNFEIYLKGHAGDDVRVDRVCREPDFIEKPALSLALTVQPDVIRSLMNRASLRGRGFLARLLYFIPESTIGSRRIAPPPVPDAVRQEYRAGMETLLRMTGTVDEAGKPIPHLLPLSADAEVELKNFETWLEPQMASGGALDFVTDWCSKLAGAVVRLSGILHMAAGVGEGRTTSGAISADTVRSAIVIGRDYLLPHAQAAFGMMGADPDVELAKVILEWIKRHDKRRFTRSDVYQHLRKRVDRVEDLDQPIARLEAHNYLRRATTVAKGPGRKPPVAFIVNPAYGSNNSGNSGNSSIP